ncbi:MAG: hypothetical protein Q9187_003541 [Circinaria calcarea]
MAKTAKLKKNAKSTSIHSRAAKRAASPSIDLDKSLKSVKPPPDSSIHRSSVLSVHNGAGISKRKAKSKLLSRHQRIRQEKGMQRAEAVMDKTEKKVEKSFVKGKTVKERGTAWDDLNNKIQGKKLKPQGKKVEEDEWEDEQVSSEMDTEEVAPTQGNGSEPVSSTLPAGSPEDSAVITEPPGEEEDVIL